MAKRDEDDNDSAFTAWIFFWILAVLGWWAVHKFIMKYPFGAQSKWAPWISVYDGATLDQQNVGSFFCQSSAAQKADVLSFFAQSALRR